MDDPARGFRTTGTLLAASALLALAGCWFGSARSGATIEHDRAVKIVPGKTTKQELLDWFGPPVALVRRGATVTMPQTGVRPVGWREVQADTFFELFASRHPPAPDDLIYYYVAAEQSEFGVFLLVAGQTSRNVNESQLWVLIDGATGKVKDFVYRKGGDSASPAAGKEPGAATAGEPR